MIKNLIIEKNFLERLRKNNSGRFEIDGVD